MSFSKTEQIIKKWPFGIDSVKTVIRESACSEKKTVDIITLSYSQGFTRSVCRSALYEHQIEVDENGNTFLKTPLSYLLFRAEPELVGRINRIDRKSVV